MKGLFRGIGAKVQITTRWQFEKQPACQSAAGISGCTVVPEKCRRLRKFEIGPGVQFEGEGLREEVTRDKCGNLGNFPERGGKCGVYAACWPQLTGKQGESAQM